MDSSSSLVSIIIPVFNAGSYLSKCIESVISQIYTNLEILLVDDGSTDSSGAICDHYGNIDNRIKVIHKKNGGVSSARNVGIRESHGEYITFIDSDDWVEQNYVSTLYHGSSTDLSVGKIRLVNTEENWWQGLFSVRDVEFNPLEEPKLIVENAQLMCKATANLYKRGLILENSVEFPETTHHMEDVVFNMRYLSICQNVVVSGSAIYNYDRSNTLSITHQVIDNDIYLESIRKIYHCLLDLGKRCSYDFSPLYIDLCGEAYCSLLKSAKRIEDIEKLREDKAFKKLSTIYPRRLGRSMKIYSILNKYDLAKLGAIFLWAFKGRW